MAWCKECSEWKQRLEMAEEIIDDKSKTINELIENKNKAIEIIKQMEFWGKQLDEALESLSRASKGSDKSWKRECIKKVESIRDSIRKLIIQRDALKKADKEI